MRGEALLDLINRPDITRIARRLGRYTIESGNEGGFAAYRHSDNGIIVSELLQPQCAPANRGNPVETLNMDALLTDSTGQGRSDVSLVVHSHPEVHNAYSFIQSAGDLLLYKHVEEGSPGHVAGILQQGFENPDLRLKLYQANEAYDPSGITTTAEMMKYATNIQSWREFIEHVGISTSIVTFNNTGWDIHERSNSLFA